MRFALSATLFSLAIIGSTAQLSGLPSGLVSSLGTTCIGALTELLSNNDLSTCLELNQAVTAFGGLGANDSIITPLQTYFSGQICPNAPCSNATLTSANSSITKGCSSDLEKGNTTLPAYLTYLFSNYDVIRSAACLQDTTMNNQLCLVQTLTNIQTATGMNLSLNALTQINSTTEQGLLTTFAENKTALCTDCNKGLVTTLSPLFENSKVSSKVTMEIGTMFAKQCGASSIGTIPTSIKASANGNSTSGAASSSSTSSASSSSSTSSSSSSGSSSGSGGSSGSASTTSSTDGVARSWTISFAAVAFGTFSLAGFLLLA